jgi:hypothetical protein
MHEKAMHKSAVHESAMPAKAMLETATLHEAICKYLLFFYQVHPFFCFALSRNGGHVG